MIRTRVTRATTFPRPRRNRVHIHRARKEDWTPEEQELINENKEWKWFLPEEDVWDLDSIREASGYKKESLEIILALMTPEEEKLVSDMVEKFEECVEKYVDEDA